MISQFAGIVNNIDDELDEKMLSKMRLLRVIKEKSLDRLAQETGIDQGFLSRIERGIVAGNNNQRLKIAEALGTRIEKLFPPDKEPGT